MVNRSEIKDRALTQLRMGWTYPVLASLILLLINICNGVPLGPLISLLVAMPLEYGMSLAYLRLIREDDIDILRNMGAEARQNYSRALAVPFLTAIFTFLWALLLIIPGIVKAYAYSMAKYISMDHPELSPNDCIEYSHDMMDGHKMDLFLLNLSFIGWIVLCIFTFGIGFLWLQPYIEASHAAFYEDIKDEEILVVDDD